MTLWEDIKRPFNLLSMIIAIISLLVAFYFYLFPHNEKRLSFVTDGPSLIFDSKLSTPKIHLVDAGNSPVKSDTYLQTFTIWNNGSVPIEPSDVRRPVRLTFDGADQILDCRIVASLDPEICDFNLSQPDKTTVELGWKHFDPKRAVKIQAIFAQTTKPKTSINANIVGIEKLTDGVRSHSQGGLSTLIPTLILAGIFGLTGTSIENALVTMSLSPKARRMMSSLIVSLLMGIIGGLCYVGWSLLQASLLPKPSI